MIVNEDDRHDPDRVLHLRRGAAAETQRVVLADRLKALADPTRIGIVNWLACADELCVCDLTDAFELSQPTISHHLRILREAGLVAASRRHLGVLPAQPRSRRRALAALAA